MNVPSSRNKRVIIGASLVGVAVTVGAVLWHKKYLDVFVKAEAVDAIVFYQGKRGDLLVALDYVFHSGDNDSWRTYRLESYDPRTGERVSQAIVETGRPSIVALTPDAVWLYDIDHGPIAIDPYSGGILIDRRVLADLSPGFPADSIIAARDVISSAGEIMVKTGDGRTWLVTSTPPSIREIDSRTITPRLNLKRAILALSDTVATKSEYRFAISDRASGTISINDQPIASGAEYLNAGFVRTPDSTVLIEIDSPHSVLLAHSSRPTHPRPDILSRIATSGAIIWSLQVTPDEREIQSVRMYGESLMVITVRSVRFLDPVSGRLVRSIEP